MVHRTRTSCTIRHDGWTADRQEKFLKALAGCGCVSHACRAVGSLQWHLDDLVDEADLPGGISETSRAHDSVNFVNFVGNRDGGDKTDEPRPSSP